MEHVYVLFAARTGSTYIMQILGKCLNSRVLCEYGEIFTSIEAIMRTYKANEKLNILESEYREWALNHPIEYIDFINSNVDSKYLFSKIQIPYLVGKDDNTIDAILKNKLIIVKRNLLHSYISQKKAELVSKYSKVNITNKKITVDPKDFYNYYNQMTNYFKKITTNLKHNQYVILNYEEIHKCKTNLDKANFIINKVKSLNIDLKIGSSLDNLLFKQDKNKDVYNKIKNYAELKDFLVKHNLTYLLTKDCD